MVCGIAANGIFLRVFTVVLCTCQIPLSWFIVCEMCENPNELSPLTLLRAVHACHASMRVIFPIYRRTWQFFPKRNVIRCRALCPLFGNLFLMFELKCFGNKIKFARLSSASRVPRTLCVCVCACDGVGNEDKENDWQFVSFLNVIHITNGV